MFERQRVDYMKRFVEILLRLIRPPVALVLLLTPLCGAAIIYSLATDLLSTVTGLVISIVFYVLSAYTLSALIIAMPGIVASIRTFFTEHDVSVTIKEKLYANKYAGKYLTDAHIKVKASLYISLAFNLSYVALKMVMGIVYASFWFGAEAVLYLMLGTVRFFILRNMKDGGDMRHEFRVYRFCGVLLFALNAALMVVVYQMINYGMGNEYPGIFIYIVATYTFIYLTISVVGLINYRKLNRPILLSAKTITFVQALIAIYSLQTSLFATFAEDDRLEYVMNSIFGGLLCIAIFGIAVYMVVRGIEKLKPR